MSEEEEDDRRDRLFMRGQRAAYRELLGVALRGLYRPELPDTPEALRKRVAQLEAERADTVAALRRACEEFGDNDWPDDLSLADVVEKYLVHGIRDRGE